MKDKEIAYCEQCYCMTKTIEKKCGKCEKERVYKEGINYCCDKLKEFIEDSYICGETIISKVDSGFKIAKEIRGCDDGDGRTDT